MQVKKFEAKTMKEALEMVKNQLGPDAIILGAKDNNRTFGLLGTTSVEVTAAISETKLKERQFAESRMRQVDKDKFRKAPAAQQKRFIDQSVARMFTPVPAQRKLPTAVQYIDIEDDKLAAAAGERVDDLLRKMDSKQTFIEGPRSAQAKQYQQRQPQGEQQRVSAVEPAQPDAKRRIQDAVKSAADIFKKDVQGPVNLRPQDDTEVIKLRQEIENLRRTVSQLNQTSPVGSHPGSEYGLPFDLCFIFEKLTKAGILPESTAEILQKARSELSVSEIKNKNLVEAWVANQILQGTLTTTSETNEKVQLFVGPSSQGKTSTLVKYAAQLVVQQRKRVALLTTDTLKVGSIDQIRIFSQILNAGFGVIRTSADWARYMREFAAADVIIVDFPGLSLKNSEEISLMKMLLPPQEIRYRAHYVQSVCAKDQDAIEIAKRYDFVGCKDVIMTHLDESLNHGIIYNFQKVIRLPLHSFGVGPRIPDDLESATRERVLDLIFKISKTDYSERGR